MNQLPNCLEKRDLAPSSKSVAYMNNVVDLSNSTCWWSQCNPVAGAYKVLQQRMYVTLIHVTRVKKVREKTPEVDLGELPDNRWIFSIKKYDIFVNMYI